MKIWNVIKYILLTVAFVIVCTVSVIGYKIYDRLCWFGIEDPIPHGHEGVITEIEGYIKEHHLPPETLSFVTPGSMADVENIKKIMNTDFEIVKTDYSIIPQRQAWKLDILVRARGKDRQFVYVSDGKLTPDEEARYYVWCHDWIVLTVP